MDENSLNSFIEEVLKEEENEFQPGLETFQMHADRLRTEITDSFQKFESQYGNGYAIIVEKMTAERLEPPSVRPEALAVFGDPLALQKALDEGKAIYQMLEFSPETMKKFFQIGRDLVKQGDFAKAKDVFYFLVTIASGIPAFWLGLGFCNAKINNFEEARSAFRQVIDLDPKNGDAYLGCMSALIKQNSTDEALKVCEEGLSVAKENQQAPWSEPLQDLLEEAKNYMKEHF